MATHLQRTLAVALLALAPSELPCQRAIREITAKPEVHEEAKISPDGTLVAFLGPSKLGIVPFVGGVESTLVPGVTVTSFLWATNSTGIYYADGNNVRFIAKGGGTPGTVGTVPGTRLAIWSSDAMDMRLYGTRFDGASGLTHVFRLATSGSSAPVDLFSSLGDLTEVRLDPTGTRLLYRETAQQPFQPVEYWSYDLMTGTKTTLTGQIAAGQPSGAQWTENGQAIVFSWIDPVSSRFQVARVGASMTPELLTQGSLTHRYSSVSGNGKWVALQSQNHSGGSGPAVLPATGGGLVALEPDTTAFVFKGPPSIDDAGVRVAFAASKNGAQSQIYAVSLDRELEIAPRPELGQMFTIEMPLQPTNEAGAVFMAAGLLVAPFPFAGLTYGFALDPTIMVQIGVRGAGMGNVVANLPVPMDMALQGASVFVQGIRLVNNMLLGDFTRYAEVSIF